MYVLLSYGQLEKTIFICNYLLIPPLRKKVSRQLNKGEQLHILKLFLRFGGDVYIPVNKVLRQFWWKAIFYEGVKIYVFK